MTAPKPRLEIADNVFVGFDGGEPANHYRIQSGGTAASQLRIGWQDVAPINSTWARNAVADVGAGQ